MKGKNSPGWGKAVGGFTLGAAAGSVIALLYAPASGKVLRKRIGMKFKSLERTTGQKFIRAKKLLARRAEGVRETAVEKLADTREWLVQRMNHRQPAPRRVLHHS